MATVTGSAAFSSAFVFLPITGFRYYQEGEIDTVTGNILPPGSSSWAALSGTSWNNWKNYRQQFNDIRWTAPKIDIGSIDYFTLNIESEYTGTIKYLIHVSETGRFGGEETTHLITNGDYNIAAFYGRYVYVTAIVSGNEFRKMLITSSKTTKSIKLADINTSTLSGSNTARQIPLPYAISGIKNIIIQPKAATSYAVNLYVSDTANSVVAIPVVVNKSSSTPTFAVYGIDNDPRDCVVDIFMEVLPRMVMFGGNLTVID